MNPAVDIAIIGMSCIFPGAPDLVTYWRNILGRVDAITDAPGGWESETFYDPESEANDRIYSNRGGFLHDLAQFRPTDYGVMPNAIGGEPDHFLALHVAHRALDDAGYCDRNFENREVEVILGKGTYINAGYTNLLQHGFIVDQTLALLRELHPEHSEEELRSIRKALKASLPPFTPETVPAMVPNIVTGRIANRLDLMGTNYTVDAACASSLIAVQQAIRDLREGRCEMVLAGGVHASTPPQIRMLFCQLGALSRKGQIRAFDRDADGTLLGEGVGIIVLKRLEDAQRDGDRIYALVKGIGTASDGKALGLLAPRVDGEELAIRRAYETTGIAPESVELVEAHGTGTLVGDVTEIQALTRVFGQRCGSHPHCAVGSVKSMISHLIPAAGVASLIKVALALRYKVLPPTLHCDTPNPKLGLAATPFYVNSDVRPWIHGGAEPRRAGVNAFGFGGVNAHAVLEEYQPADATTPGRLGPVWDTELVIVQGTSRGALAERCDEIARAIDGASDGDLPDLAYTLNCGPNAPLRVGLVVRDTGDLRVKLTSAAQRLRKHPSGDIKDRKGTYYFESPLAPEGKLAFVFPGEGAQYIGMMGDLCLHFPEVRSCFDRSDRVFALNGHELRPSQLVFPPPHAELPADFDSKDRLWQLDVAAETVFTADHALYRLLAGLGIRPNAMVGHSSGELAALVAAGAVTFRDEEDMARQGARLNHLFTSLAPLMPEAKLLTVGATDPEAIRSIVAASGGAIRLALDNCPHQAVLCGAEEPIAAAMQELHKLGAICGFLPFGRAYHTAGFDAVARGLEPFFAQLEVDSPKVPLWSCATAAIMPADSASIRRLACGQWAMPVRFTETVEAMYREGVRIFVEVGPRGNLTNFIEDILGKRNGIAIPTNVMRHSGLAQLHHALALLAAQGVPMNLERLYAGRAVVLQSLDDLRSRAARAPKDGLGVRLTGELPRLRLGDNWRASPTARTEHPVKPEASEPELGPVATLPRAALPSPRAQVMERHFAQMEQWMSAQQDVMQAYLRKAGSPAPQLPANFLIDTNVQAGGRELAGTCEFRLDEDIFLLDHTIGRRPSDVDAALSGLPVVPLTVSVEVMAQVAARLAPGERLLRIDNLRAHRWIEVPTPRRSVPVWAGLEETDGRSRRIRVRLLDDNENEPLIEGSLTFGAAFPEPEATNAPVRGKAVVFPHVPEQYYDIMFHGPRFRTVRSVDRVDEEYAEATLASLEPDTLFRTRSGKGMFTNPALLDGAGQLIGFWAWDRFETGFTIFPFGFDSLRLYAPFPLAGAPVKCAARIRHFVDGRIESDIDLLDVNGRLIAAIGGWKDMRLFDWSREFARFVLEPRRNAFSRPFSEAVAGLTTDIECCRVSECGAGIWSRVLAHMILNPRERETWHAIRGPEKRRREWLLGRMAVKDAVRQWVRKHRSVEVCPADIEIVNLETGQPSLAEEFTQRTGLRLRISIAHSSGAAMGAAAGDSACRGVGIDVEELSEAHDPQSVLTTAEVALMEGSDKLSRQEALLRIWCAKEAVAKAMGMGLGGVVRDLEACELNPRTGVVTVTTPSGRLPALTATEMGYVFASAVV